MKNRRRQDRASEELMMASLETLAQIEYLKSQM